MDEKEVVTLVHDLQQYSHKRFHGLRRKHNQFTSTIQYRMNELGRKIEENKIAVTSRAASTTIAGCTWLIESIGNP